MFEFRRLTINTLNGSLIAQDMAHLNLFGREGWEIKAVCRGLTGNTEVIYLERELEDEE